MDRSWIQISNRLCKEYVDSVEAFVNLVENHLNGEEKTRCPCRNCRNMELKSLDDVERHLHRLEESNNSSEFGVHINADKFSALFDDLVNVPTFPASYYDAKKILRDLGLGYETIHVCKYDCALFEKNMKVEINVQNMMLKGGRILIRNTIGLQPQNVRLGLATDGFNPFGNMNNSYRPKAPGKDIYVYPRPSIEELKELWDVGVQTYDVSKEQYFRMHVAVLWTVNDVSTYDDMFGSSTKGYKACPMMPLRHERSVAATNELYALAHVDLISMLGHTQAVTLMEFGITPLTMIID
ncbi:hypothetical protein WN943_003666 [Citrus x changshan-huyou]